MVIILYSILYS